jgi:arylsulfatase A-like enzyme
MDSKDPKYRERLGCITRRDWLNGVSSAMAVAGLNACSQQATKTTAEKQPPSTPPDRPNIIVYLMDTLRADHLSCYGYAAQTSPGIDWLAGQGVLFEENISGSNWTKPSLGTMFTGVPARVHRAVVSSPFVGSDNTSQYRVDILRDVFKTLPELLQSAGYSTAYMQANPHGLPELGYGRGFDISTCISSISPKAQIEAALHWINNTAHEPFFLFIHEIDPHGPFVPLPRSFRRLHGAKSETFLNELSEDEAGRVTRYVEMLGSGPEIKRDVRDISDEANRYIQMKYDAEIYQVDSLVEQFVIDLAKLGIMDHTIFTFTSDHGEAFGEHNYYAHGSGNPFDELLRVPLIMAGGGLPRGVRVPHNTTMLDFYPTLLELAKVPIPSYIPGKPMFSAEGDLLVKEDRMPYIDIDRQAADLSDWDAAIVLGKYKVATQKRGEVYLIFDRESDPGEHKNLVGTGALPTKIEQDLIATLQSEVAKYEQMGREFGEPEWSLANEGLQEDLHALGYI